MDDPDNPLLSKVFWSFDEFINPANAILPINEKIRKEHFSVFNWNKDVKLYDPYGKVHQVEYDANRDPPAITTSWAQLVDYYRLQIPYNCQFHYIGLGQFVIKIKDQLGREIDYKQNNEQGNGISPKVEYVLDFKHILTNYKATRSHLDIPFKAAKYVRKHKKDIGI